MKFLDQIKIYIKAGKAVLVQLKLLEEKYIEFGGPDGGDGVYCGSVVLL